jgi:hypothetical protein
MNVSGCVGQGETSTDYTNLPGSPSLGTLTVGNQPITVLVVYIQSGGGGVGTAPPPSVYLDAFDETTGAFLNNYFVTSTTPDNALTSNVNVYGPLVVEPHSETVLAALNPINTPTVANNSASFDKWVILEGPAGNPKIGATSASLVIGPSTPSDIVAFAFYKEPASVYITGGYQSPDIILFTPFSTALVGSEVTLGIAGAASNVSPNVNYGFAAVVHNGSEFDVSVNVTFWNIPGGVGTAGTLLDTQSVIVLQPVP